MGAAFAIKGGTLLEEYSFYVPYGAYEEAKNLAETVCGTESDPNSP